MTLGRTHQDPAVRRDRGLDGGVLTMELVDLDSGPGQVGREPTLLPVGPRLRLLFRSVQRRWRGFGSTDAGAVGWPGSGTCYEPMVKSTVAGWS